MSRMTDKIMLPRTGGWFRAVGYIIRCGCWQCRIPLWRRRHVRKLIKMLEAR